MTTLFEEAPMCVVSEILFENDFWYSKFFGLPFQLDTAEGVVPICE